MLAVGSCPARHAYQCTQGGANDYL